MKSTCHLFLGFKQSLYMVVGHYHDSSTSFQRGLTGGYCLCLPPAAAAAVLAPLLPGWCDRLCSLNQSMLVSHAGSTSIALQHMSGRGRLARWPQAMLATTPAGGGHPQSAVGSSRAADAAHQQEVGDVRWKLDVLPLPLPAPPPTPPLSFLLVRRVLLRRAAPSATWASSGSGMMSGGSRVA